MNMYMGTCIHLGQEQATV